MRHSPSQDPPEGMEGPEADHDRLRARHIPQLVTQSRPSPMEVASKLFPYIRGPIPLAWMMRALGISHATAAVGLMLWHLRSLQRSRTVRLEPRWYAKFSVHRNTVQRALAALERAGLVRVEEQPGRPAEVTLLAREPKASDAGGYTEGIAGES
jgi:DNA-binding transcriptional ArsR family regulator